MPEKPLRILFAAMRWPAETFISRLIVGLMKENIEITVACAQKPGRQWIQNPSFNWLPVPDTMRRIAGLLFPIVKTQALSFFHSPANYLEITKLLNLSKQDKTTWLKYSPFLGNSWDILYFPWNSGAILFERLIDLGIPTLISCRGSQINIAPHNPQREDFTNGLKRTLTKATRIHCVSDDIKTEVSTLGINTKKCDIIRPAVDPDYFTPMQGVKTSDITNFISTGSLIWRKGYEDALLALRSCIDLGVNAQLEIIGTGPEKQRILYTIDDLGLTDHVKLSGQLPPEQVLSHLQRSDAFLLSSLSEGISNAVLEAMSCGLPVISTDCGGMREAITDGIEGYLTQIRDPQTMALRMQQLANEPELRVLMGNRGRERIIRDFNLVDQINQYINMFYSIAGR